MTTLKKWFEIFSWFIQSIWFCKSHFFTIFGLGLVAAFGRVSQLGAFGPVSSSSHLLLEIVIESVRVMIFLFALGLTNVRIGAVRVAALFTNRNSVSQKWNLALQQVKNQWVVLLLNFMIFLIFAWLINLLIGYTAYQTCLYKQLKTNHIISTEASEWVLILFFKNISVIPFTLVFNALFVLWITNRLTRLIGS